MKKRITRMIAITMAFVLLLSFAACGGKDKGETTTTPESTAQEANATTEPSSQDVANPSGETSTTPVVTPSEDTNNLTAAPVAGENPTNYSKAEIISYYNKACNKTMSLNKFTAKRDETVDIKIDSIEGLGALNSLGKAAANSVVKKYAKTSTYTETYVDGRCTEDKDKKPIDFLQPAKLEPAGAASATVKKVSNGYEVSITVVKETATLKQMPKFHSQCMSPLDLAKVDIKPFEISAVDFTYPGGKITAVIDNEGRVISQKILMPLSGSGTGGFKAVQLTAVLHGSFNQTITYTL